MTRRFNSPDSTQPRERNWSGGLRGKTNAVSVHQRLPLRSLRNHKNERENIEQPPQQKESDTMQIILDPITSTNQERMNALRQSPISNHSAIVEGYLIPHAYGTAVEMVQHVKETVKKINLPMRILTPEGNYMMRVTPEGVEL